MLTGYTITDEQIRALWRLRLIDSSERNIAIRTYRHGLGNTLRMSARVRCAAIWNNTKQPMGDGLCR